MEKAKVYWTDMRSDHEPLTGKLKRLLKKAGINQIDLDGKFVAIKMHFGELGNLAHIRPQYAKAVADVVKEFGGKPFLTDCNTLYPGSRKNALEHLQCASLNGFNEVTTGCQIIIGDGLKGTDDVAVKVEGGTYVSEAYIGRAIMDADVFISLTHFKGHGGTGFGGALKNIGMGCGSRAGKKAQHSDGKCKINADRCRGCRRCAMECQQNAITYGENRKASIDLDKCVGCGHCIGACNFDAISSIGGSSSEALCCKIAEYSKAVLDGRPHFHIALAIDISPECDCFFCNDAPILPNIGMFASFDPVALDQAINDMCLQQIPLAQSSYADKYPEQSKQSGNDIWTLMSNESKWEACVSHGEQLGIGTRDYQLIKMR